MLIAPSLLGSKSIEEASQTATVVILMTPAGIEASGVELMGQMFNSEDFKADFALDKCCWFYHQATRKRCLLLSNAAKGNKAD